MDGKIFNRSASSVAITNFDFDLQRFTSTDPGTSFLTEGLSITKNNVKTVYYSSEEAVGNATQQSGDLFEVSDKDGGNKRYFSNIHAALNYVYDAQTTGATPTKIYKDSNTYKATIKLLGDVTNGKPFMLGGKEYEHETEKELSVTVEDSDITIDLDGHSYLFAEALTSDTTAGLGRAKGITTEDDNKRSMSDSKAKNNTDKAYVTIKNGSFGVAANASAKFERMIKSYINLTLDSVTIDGSNFPVAPAGIQGKNNGLEKSFDGAIVNQSGGALNIIGSTSIIAPEGYYAVSEKLSGTANHGSSEFNFAVNTTGTISNIAFYEWKDDNGNNEANFSKSGNGISIGGGTIGQVMFSEKALNTGAMTITSINGGAVVNSITYGDSANSLAYAESTLAAYYDVRQDAKGKFFYFGKDGWNSDSTTEKKFNFVAESVASGNTNKLGQIIIAAEGATNTDSFAYDSGNKVFGLPTNITATWGPGLENTLKANYAVAKMDYASSAKDAVTISEVSLGADTFKPVFIAKNDSTEKGGLFAETVKKIDASALSVAASIVGNSLDNTIYGGTDNDSLTGGVGTATSLRGSNTFYFSAGKDVITDFNRNTDKIVITTEDFAPAASQINSSATDFNISLSSANQLKLNGVSNLGTKNVLPTNGVKVAAERNGREIANYVYTAYSVADMTGDKANGVTLGSAAGNSFTASNPFVTIDASATSIAGGFNITGFTNANYILAGQNGGSLNGNGGDDTLRGGDGADVFIYSAGKNVIEEYDKEKDVLSMTTNNITSAKSSRKGLVFSTKNSSNILTFKPVGDAEDAVEKISLNGGGFLTKDGAVNSIGSAMKFNLFAGTKGAIDLVNDTIYKGAGIASIDATEGKNSVTLTADSLVSSLALGKNTKKDVFVYGGGALSISGYEDGKDRLNIADKGVVSLFTVDKDSGDVKITVGSDSANVISLKGAQGQEVLIHDENSRGSSYSKFVFHDTGVLYNKAKKPTEATLSAGAASLKADDSIKKIFAVGLGKSISIESGAIKSTLDASEASEAGEYGVSLIGGAKNNRFIGSAGKDLFEYKGGKDVIESFVTTGDRADSVKFDDFGMNDAKITLSKKSVKFKFAGSKNALTIKSDSTISGSLYVNGKNYTFDKNAYSTDGGKNVSLTSAFSGTYKVGKDDNVQLVDGHLVQKNLTFKGTDKAETFIGGKKKTTFKGGGGADSLVGGAGKDIFFYAKGDAGTSTIADFEFGVGKDKLKIANGTISKISSLEGGGVQFAMTSGKKGDTSPVGWFNITSKAEYNNGENTLTNADEKKVSDKVAIKANNTYYWFAKGNELIASDDENSTLTATAGSLITFENKVKANDDVLKDCAVIDLGYSTNLAKTNVAIKVTDKPTQTQS